LGYKAWGFNFNFFGTLFWEMEYLGKVLKILGKGLGLVWAKEHGGENPIA